MKRSLLQKVLCLSLFAALSVGAGLGWAAGDDDEDDNPYIEKGWEEIKKVTLPAAPKDSNLLPFYVSPIATTRFAVDSASLTVDKDAVVRYTLVATSSSGTRSVTYEGIHCDSFEQRLYAVLKQDGTWSETRGGWRRIREASQNRQYAALAREHFCAGRDPYGSAEKIVARIRAAGGR